MIWLLYLLSRLKQKPLSMDESTKTNTRWNETIYIYIYMCLCVKCIQIIKTEVSVCDKYNFSLSVCMKVCLPVYLLRLISGSPGPIFTGLTLTGSWWCKEWQKLLFFTRPPSWHYPWLFIELLLQLNAKVQKQLRVTSCGSESIIFISV